jgi:hypothetical protein
MGKLQIAESAEGCKRQLQWIALSADLPVLNLSAELKAMKLRKYLT